MSVQKTVFGRHYKYAFVKQTHMTTNNDNDFYIDAPKNGYIIDGTVARFFNDSLEYMCIQQLNSCDACIVTHSFVNAKSHYDSTVRLVSYDTLVCEARFLSENMRDNGKPYIEFILGEYWNYSPTTIQHVYKFLRKFGFTNVQLSKLAKQDLKEKGYYTYKEYEITNNVGRIGVIRFSSAIAITDFALNNAVHFVERQMKYAG